MQKYGDRSQYRGEVVFKNKYDKLLNSTYKDRISKEDTITMATKMRQPKTATGGWIPEGYGEFTWPNGDKYTGDFVDGRSRQGKGKMEYANGDVYDGEWNLADRCGQGRMAYENGDVYDGQWFDSQHSGQGTMVFADSTTYTGAWKFHLRTDQGEQSWPNGDRYDGQWLNDLHDGFGKTYYKNGDRHEGTWRQGTKHGSGRYWWANRESEAQHYNMGEMVDYMSVYDNQYDVGCRAGTQTRHKGKNDNIQAHRVLPSERQERRRYADKANAKYISK
jgi:hypothetical protein